MYEVGRGVNKGVHIEIRMPQPPDDVKRWHVTLTSLPTSSLPPPSLSLSLSPSPPPPKKDNTKPWPTPPSPPPPPSPSSHSKVSIPSTSIDDLRTLLRLSRIPRKTYESVNADRENKFWYDDRPSGAVAGCLVGLLIADVYWGKKRRKQESYINSHPQYLATPKTSDGKELKIHFAALFSKKKDAIPIILSHGWPGSFMEFYGILDLVKKQYTPETLISRLC
ncbi:hypothetical protein L198_07886 [Cryptococcus wingfieldii CBS 7118]|uniref:Epoxide hydrolase N-terminal domain-containing protein n=1 Tax=Cryptococcus wingfieldii CBS 7118 TaxID=1295528 RepID=A0A1E3HWD0_9TREE|nr:hypothetical protein L198_07886 [Cryptococcus wingfieldii CBS 7118]ODN80076.1 hypothetical protein L198_07886 [Cryptococcus wingfieldii CBS 7118]